jgi:hypothetical protein
MEGKPTEDTAEFLQELKNQAATSSAKGESNHTWADTDGIAYEWDVEKQGWFPKVR